MIEKDEAQRIAASIQQRSADDPERPWHLVEFAEGWLISEVGKNRGAVTKVVEKTSGRVLRFPSHIPPRRIMEEYSLVVEKGREERR